MSFRIRLLVLTGLLAVGATASAPAQRGTLRPRPEAFRIKRPPYGYFKYRIPSQALRITPRIELQRRTLDRALRQRQDVLDRQFALRDRVRERAFDLQDRVRERALTLQDRTWRRQLEARERALVRLKDRIDRTMKLRPFANRRHWRTI